MADIRKAAGRVAGLAANGARTLGSLAAKKTKNAGRIARLNVDIASERDIIKSNYLELGRLYYETHREAPDDELLQLCREIDVSLETIAAKEAVIAGLKADTSSRAAEEKTD